VFAYLESMTTKH